MSQVLDSLEAARGAATRLAWREANATLSDVYDAELGPEDSSHSDPMPRTRGR